jgi:hypothetical protein
MAEDWNNFWKENWDLTRERFAAWWRHDGLILDVIAPLDRSRFPNPPDFEFTLLTGGIDVEGTVGEPCDLETAWLDPERRAHLAERYLGSLYFGGESFPYYDTHIGPGNLATFIGSQPTFAADTVWYEPCIPDPDNHPPLRFDPTNPWFVRQRAIIEAGVRIRQGRFLVGMPDLIENVDILASLRGSQTLMFDMVERPEFVRQRIAEINRVYMEAFDTLFALIRDPWGGNAFSAFHISGPGKTAKVQCDAAAMISPRMFDEFVIPALTEQCAWLDYAMYHLDGTQAMPHLDQLLEVEPLRAIEWTPQAGIPQGGDPAWYDLYRRILKGGKSVQVIDVRPDQVIPLLDAIGSKGVFIMTRAASEAEARDLAKRVEKYR